MPLPAGRGSQVAGINYYNFQDLINKAERIVLGEIGEKNDGAVSIKAIETLKGPARDPKAITAETIRRAEELMNSGKSSVPAPRGDPPPENVNIAVIPPAENMLPPAGTQVIFFLWEMEKGKREEGGGRGETQKGAVPTYRINHPQCIYESSVLPQVRVALLKPRSIADGRFLRERDAQAAGRAAQRKMDEELKKALAEPVLGLAIECVRPHLLLKGDNSFMISSNLLNTYSKELAVYDGPAAAYGVVIRAKDAALETALVLHLNSFDDVDPAALNITSLTDFDSISGNGQLARDHKFEAQKYPALKNLSGDYLVRMFYTNAKDGKKDGLSAPAWTGTVISAEIPLQFKKANP
ncbi:MAG TPA: hypothetical protein VKX17_11335 [Planctomycetota bacterium]|nr:hypothetical protein [Planctomycetota bacterium]